MAAQNSQFQEETRNNQRNIIASIKNTEVHMGQMIQQLTNQAQGTLLCAIIQNSRHHENVNIVTIKSQKVAKDEEDKATNHEHIIEVDHEVRENKKNHKKLHHP